MNGENRHIYRLGYKGAQHFGAKVSFVHLGLGMPFFRKIQKPNQSAKRSTFEVLESFLAEKPAILRFAF